MDYIGIVCSPVLYERPTIIYEFDDDNLLVRATKRRRVPYLPMAQLVFC